MNRLHPVGFALLPLAACAQDALRPLFVTATRGPDTMADAPYTSALLDRDYLEDNTRRTIPEALQFTPGVLVQKTAHGHGSPFIRGFTGRQNLLLVEGVRLNNSVFRGGPVQYWNTVDPLALDRIELVKSQGSVLYGSDAVGGTVQAFTRATGFREQTPGAFFSRGSTYYEYRSNGDDSHLGRVESSFGVGGKFGAMVGVSAKDFGDIRDSAAGLMRHTGYPEQDLDFRLEAALGPATTLTLATYQLDQDDVWRWHSTIYNPGWQHDGHVAAPGTYRARVFDQEHSLTFLRVESENPDQAAWLRRWRATLSWQTGDEREYQDRGKGTSVDRRNQITEVDTLGFDLTLESPLGPANLTYGLDFYQDWVDAAGFRDRGKPGALVPDPAQRPVADDSTYQLFGAFAQAAWKPVEPVEITGGLRYTRADASLGRYYDATAKQDLFDANRSWDNVVGSLRAIGDLGCDWSLYGGISQAFRAPNLDDLSGNLTARSGVAATGNVTVEPEEFLTYELGLRRQTDKLAFNAAVFYTDITDTIVGVPAAKGSSTTIATNGRDGYVFGTELEAEWLIDDQWKLGGFVAWQDGKTKTPQWIGGPILDEPVSRLLPLTASVALRWTHPSQKFWVEGRLLAADDADRLSEADKGDTQRIPTGGTPSYLVAMLHAGWRPNDHMEFTLGLENLTDEDYRIHGSGQNEPGFSAILGAKLMW